MIILWIGYIDKKYHCSTERFRVPGKQLVFSSALDICNKKNPIR